MINDWKLGMRRLRHAYGVKLNCITAGLLLLLEVPAVILGRVDGNGFLACYILLVMGMLPVQMLLSLSVSSMVQTSPMKKKLQTKIPALVNLTVMWAVYLAGTLLSCIMIWGKPENRGEMYGNLLLLALSLAMVMVYMGAAYKHFILASVCLIPVLCTAIAGGLTGGIRGFLMGMGKGIPLWQTALLGLAIVAAGAAAEYLLSLLFYKAPMDRMAQSGRLRREI